MNSPPAKTATDRSDTPPLLMDTCTFCGRRCRVPVTRHMPRDAQDKYTAAGWDSMATCEGGAVHEHRRFGASYADVISDRIARVHDFSFAKE
jgi:hypothetical protein